ncbi:hypothetical protein K438DRAFT_2170037 [Mycena galopus ATCC 62051]|nr:hypothetical protein K438DRAFT_2170037 [Mycena galopus ATCC 62051]
MWWMQRETRSAALLLFSVREISQGNQSVFSNATGVRCSACQKTDWKTHKESCGSQDFWDYPHKPLLTSEANFERPAALRCQMSLLESSPDVLYNVAPGTDLFTQSERVSKDALRFTIRDKMLSVSFRRVRDKAFMTRDPESIAILGEVLVTAVEAEAEEPSHTPIARRTENVCSQLEEEYDMPVSDMIFALLNEQMLDPSSRSRLQCLHEENLTNHPSDFWRALARPLD